MKRWQLLIVPPFQLRGVVSWADITRSQLLSSKPALIRCMDDANDNCSGTGLAVAPYARYLAAIVNYSAFWGASQPYAAPNIFDAEPYYIAHTAEHLAFDERYVAWGGDKAEQFHRVMLQNSTLLVSPEWYIVHASMGAL